MTDENQYKLILINKLSLQKKGNSQTIIGNMIRLNSEVHTFFGLKKILKNVNDNLFAGKGKLTPIDHCYSFYPNEESTSDGSRFQNLFTLEGKLSNVDAGFELQIERDDLKGVKGDFSSFSLRFSYGIDTVNSAYNIDIYVRMDFPGNRDYEGNWGGKAVFMSYMADGRVLEFPLRSKPSAEEISKIVMQNVQELLDELSKQGLLPAQNSSN